MKNESFHRRLSVWERFTMGTHYWVCAGCARMAKQLEFLHSAAGRLFEHADKNQPPPVLSEQARTRIQQHLRDSEQDDTNR